MQGTENVKFVNESKLKQMYQYKDNKIKVHIVVLC